MNVPNLNLCLVPLEIVWNDKKANLEKVADIFKKIHPQTDIVILPETFSTGFPSGKNKEEVRDLAERNTEETVDFLKDLSESYNMAIAGSFIANSGGLLYNRSFFIEPSGDEYFQEKRHLFPLGGEDKIFSKGEKRLHVRFRGWNIDLVVCYDLRFPVWCRNRNNEYDLLIAIANWPVSRIAIWEKLLCARAIENISYVCGVNCRGIDSTGIDYDGTSFVFDYKGHDKTVRISEEGLMYASVSMEKLIKFRESFPAWKDADDFNLS